MFIGCFVYKPTLPVVTYILEANGTLVKYSAELLAVRVPLPWPDNCVTVFIFHAGFGGVYLPLCVVCSEN